MYHAIIKKKVKTGFKDVNGHGYDEVTKEVSLNVRHGFAGQHSLGGERNDRHARKYSQTPWLMISGGKR